MPDHKAAIKAALIAHTYESAGHGCACGATKNPQNKLQSEGDWFADHLAGVIANITTTTNGVNDATEDRQEVCKRDHIPESQPGQLVHITAHKDGQHIKEVFFTEEACRDYGPDIEQAIESISRRQFEQRQQRQSSAVWRSVLAPPVIRSKANSGKTEAEILEALRKSLDSAHHSTTTLSEEERRKAVRQGIYIPPDTVRANAYIDKDGNTFFDSANQHIRSEQYNAALKRITSQVFNEWAEPERRFPRITDV